jgi:uncharacterized protein YdaU (DUF1376 family)
MNGLPYYKAYPRDFIEGTVGMPFELKGAYRLVLDLIYLQGGRLPDNARYISGHLGCSSKQWTYFRKALIARGKLSVQGDVLINDRAHYECELTENLRRTQRDNRAKRGAPPNENKGIPLTTVQPSFNHTDTDTDTEKKEREAKASLFPKEPPKRKTRIPETCSISEEMRAAAVARGLSDAEAEAQFTKFRDWAVAKGQSYVDWGAAWRNWLTSPFYKPALKPEIASGRPSRSDQRLDAYLRGATG